MLHDHRYPALNIAPHPIQLYEEQNRCGMMVMAAPSSPRFTGPPRTWSSPPRCCKEWAFASTLHSPDAPATSNDSRYESSRGENDGLEVRNRNSSRTGSLSFKGISLLAFSTSGRPALS